MNLDEAISKYLNSPIVVQKGLDERAFFNVLLDLRAFDESISSKFIVLAFIEQGFLKEAMVGSNNWKLRAIHYLTSQRGFDKKQVEQTMSSIERGFKGYSLPKNESSLIRKEKIDLQHYHFKKYNIEELQESHPSKPLDFSMQKGDIVLAKNGIAIINDIEEDHLVIRYLKAGLTNPLRTVYYDENLEFILSSNPDTYFVSRDDEYFYIKTIDVERSGVRICGMFSDKLIPVKLVPYIFLRHGFKPCKEEDFS